MPVARPTRLHRRSSARRLAGSLARPATAAALVLVTLLAVAPGSASALEPPRPLPGYRAAFVTETDERPWRDCLWASAAMLLDKWTNGDVTRTHQRLRTLSGDEEGGSSLLDLRVAFRKLGFEVELDADGDATMTWHALLRRLKDGGGAIVLGDYGQLPQWYGRWDYRFWKGKGTSGNDNHAVYVERYDPSRGVVWLMDPLGRGDYEGEWLPIQSLARYAWFKSGRVQAVATPAARPAPFAGVRLVGDAVAVSSEALSASWDVRAGKRWRFQGADVRPSIEPEDDPIEGAARSAAAGALPSDDAAADRPQAAVQSRVLEATAALPEAPGAYTASVTITDRRFGRTVARSVPVTAFVPGDRRATLRLDAGNPATRVEEALAIGLLVVNSGSEAWAAPERYEASERSKKPRPTRVVATWIRLDDDVDGMAMTATDAGPARATELHRYVVDLGRVTVDPGMLTRLETTVDAPREPGRWALVIDLVNGVDGSFAALGSRPAVAIYDVRPQASPVEVDPNLD